MSPAAASARTVVVATGVDAVRDRFTEALEDAGHRALGLATPAALIDRLAGRATPVDLVLLDLGIDPDRPALLEEIRRAGAGIPVVVFSGSVADATEVRTLVRLGVAGYVNEHSDRQHILPALAPHLFPDSFNRRGSPRVDLAIPVSYRADSTVAGALTLNLGKGGMAIRTMSPLEASTRVRVRFRLPGADREIEADSRIVWRNRRVGMGLQFEQVDPADQAAVDEYVDLQQLEPDGWTDAGSRA